MADMGFLPDVRRILDLTPSDRQTLLFSATLDGDIDVLVRRYQHDPARHELEVDEDDTSAAVHLFWKVASGDRVDRTADVVSASGPTIVFCRTKHSTDRIARQLEQHGVRAAAIHGDRSQKQREQALDSFVRGAVDALVATDVAARGIHVDGVNAVIHFDPPTDSKDYVHRSGRTARAGATGVVVSLVTPDKVGAVRKIQRDLGLPGGTTTPDIDAVRAVIGEPPKRRPSDPRRPADATGAARSSQGRPDRSRRPTGPWKARPTGARNGSSGNGSKGGARSNGAERAGAGAPRDHANTNANGNGNGDWSSNRNGSGNGGATGSGSGHGNGAANGKPHRRSDRRRPRRHGAATRATATRATATRPTATGARRRGRGPSRRIGRTSARRPGGDEAGHGRVRPGSLTGGDERARSGAPDHRKASTVVAMPADAKPTIAIPDGPPPDELVIEDIEVGDGAEAVAGRPVNVHYVGVSWSTGQEFDSSWSRSELFSFPLGAGHVIPGLGPGCRRDEGGRPPTAHHPAPSGLRRPGRRRGHRPRRDAGVRGRPLRRGLRRPWSRLGTASAQRNRSSAGGRTISVAADAGRSHSGSTPRSTAAGMPRSLPITISAAPASSSATHTSVASRIRPCGVGGAPEVDDAGHAGDADGHVGDPAAPGATEGVGDDDPHRHPVPVEQRLADPAGRPVRVDGQQGRGPGVHVGQVHAGVGADEAMARLGDQQVARAGARCAPTPARPVRAWPSGSSASMGTTRPSALDTTFWVTTTTSPSTRPPGTAGRRAGVRGQRLGQQLGQVVARPHLTDPGDREDGQPAPGPAATAGAPGRRSADGIEDRPAQLGGHGHVDMRVGATTHRTPSASTRSASGASASSMTRVPPTASTTWPPPRPTTRTPSRGAAGRPGP